MKNEIGHTPTPWIINKIYNRNIYGVMKGKNQILATCYMREEEDKSDGEGEANAAFIVRAVNRDHLFEELLRAAKRSHTDCDAGPNQCGMCGLIARAEGE